MRTKEFKNIDAVCRKVKCVKFSMNEAGELLKWIKANGGKIDSVKYRELEKHRAEELYKKNPSWALVHDPEKYLENEGWEKDEILWVSLEANNIYAYQLILKEGDWVAFGHFWDGEGYRFYNVGQNCFLPNNEDWLIDG